MIKNILDMLPYAQLGQSELIDIAKGKNKLPENLKELKKAMQWQLKRQ
jgi:hypothetical protein